MPQQLLLLPLKALGGKMAGLPGSAGQPSGLIGPHGSWAELPTPLQPEGLNTGPGRVVTEPGQLGVAPATAPAVQRGPYR